MQYFTPIVVLRIQQICLAGASLYAALHLVHFKDHPEKYKKVRQLLLGLIALISLASYNNFFSYHGSFSAHVHDFFHHYLPARYPAYIRYDSLYSCTLEATREIDPSGKVELLNVLSLRSGGILSNDQLSVAGKVCKSRFPREEWGAFKKDVTVLKNLLPPENFARFFSDHGFNASPFWLATAKLFTFEEGINEERVKLLSFIDYSLILAICGVVYLLAGFETACFFIIFLGSNPFATYRWNGNSFLRFDWFFYLSTGFLVLQRGKFLAGGFLLGIATASRIFPIVPLAAVAIALHRESSTQSDRGEFKDFISGAFLAVLVTVGVSLFSFREPAGVWLGFFENLSRHMASAGLNRMGPFRIFEYFYGGIISPSNPIFQMLILGGLLLIGNSIRDKRALPTAVATLVFIPLANYYFVVLAVLSLLWRYMPAAVLFLMFAAFIGSNKELQHVSSYTTVVWSLIVLLLGVSLFGLLRLYHKKGTF